MYCDKIIVLIDCDRDCSIGNALLISTVIEKLNSKNVTRIKFKWEIEDWLCANYDISLDRKNLQF